MKGFSFLLFMSMALLCACQFEPVESVYTLFDLSPSQSEEFFTDVVQTPDGGYAVAGNTLSGPNAGMFVQKLDKSGNPVWTRNFLIHENGELPSVAGMCQSAGGELVAAGWIGNYSFIARIAASGSVIESKNIVHPDYQSMYILGLDEAPDGDIVLICAAEPVNAAGAWTPVLVRLDKTAGALGSPAYTPIPFSGKILDKSAGSIAVQPNGNIALALNYIAGGTTATLLTEFDPAGKTTVFSHTLSGTEDYIQLRSLDIASDGALLAGGVKSVAGQNDIFIVRADKSAVRSATIGEFETEECSDIFATADGAIAITGLSKVNGVNAVALYIVDQETFAIRHQNTFDGGTPANEDIGRSIYQTIDKGFIIAGYTIPSGAFRGYLIKTDPEGN